LDCFTSEQEVFNDLETHCRQKGRVQVRKEWNGRFTWKSVSRRFDARFEVFAAVKIRDNLLASQPRRLRLESIMLHVHQKFYVYWASYFSLVMS